MANIINKYIDKYKDKLLGKVNNTLADMGYTLEDQIIPKDPTTISASNSITSFRNKLESAGGLARSNQFMISFELPSWMQSSKYLSYLGITQFNEELGLLCNKVTPPVKTVQSQAVKYHNNVERKIPTGYKWDEITFSFIERNDYFIFNTFNEWIDGVNNPVTNTGRFYRDIISDVKINLIDKQNNILAYYALSEAYPVSVDIGTLDWGQENGLVSIDVTFNFIYATHKEYELTAALKSIQEFGSSDVVNTLNDVKNYAISGSGLFGDLKSNITKWFK